jgi:23S rRNA (adenine2503-C2)-methyltransferase
VIVARNGVTPERLQAALTATGCTISEARRIVSYTLKMPGDPELAGVRQVRREVREAARALAPVRRLRKLETRASKLDPFVKYAFETHDGLVIEAVRIPLEKAGRFSVCLSSQVGCAMGCTFCATSRMTARRDLEVWEIVDQVTQVVEDLPAGTRVHGAVFMGMGEPMLNLDAVLEAAAILSHPAGHAVGAPAITISTVGLVPGIRRLTAEDRPYRLGVSLTSARSALRRRLMPVEGRWPIPEVMAAARDHARARGQLVMLSYVMLGGVNTSDDDARALAELCRGEPVRVSLIEWNPWDTPEPYRPPTLDELKRFRAILAEAQVPIIRRYSGGKDVDAACGQLAGTRSWVTSD